MNIIRAVVHYILYIQVCLIHHNTKLNLLTILGLKVVDLRDVKKKLKDAEFEETTWENLGRELGLHPNTLAKIIANKTDVESRFTECLTKWLMRVDDVDSIGEPTYNSLIAALKKMDGTKDVFEALSECITKTILILSL